MSSRWSQFCIKRIWQSMITVIWIEHKIPLSNTSSSFVIPCFNDNGVPRIISHFLKEVNRLISLSPKVIPNLIESLVSPSSESSKISLYFFLENFPTFFQLSLQWTFIKN